MTSRFACLCVVVLGLMCSMCQSADRERALERPAAVAGSFYPGDAVQLSTFVDQAISSAAASEPGQVVAIIAPHAGYQYSGMIAGQAYSALREKQFKRVIVIGPSHTEAFDFTSVYEGDAYTTPLGKVPVDRDFARRLANADRSIHLSSSGHTVGERGEHSVEVQLPFLQRTVGEFRLVPIVMGDHTYAASRKLGLALAKLLKNDTSTLIVASSDLSHYHGYDQATRMDQHLLEAIGQNDFLSVSHNVGRGVWEACGVAPIIATMIAAEKLGSSGPRVLKYANSGDTAGDKSRVVGYGAVIFSKSGTNAETKLTLSSEERSELLRIAKASVESAVREHRQYQAPVPSQAALRIERGVFVTLTKDGELRGCIGYTSPIITLYEAVTDVAEYAALRDPRFPPVRADELGQLQYEISVLSPFRHVLDTNSVKVGEHGLLLRHGDREGVLLPQVPVEQKWDRATFLKEVALKAGLNEEAWRDEGTDLFTFTALVFSDHEQSHEKR